jgi:sulfatase modifying factor 1
MFLKLPRIFISMLFLSVLLISSSPGPPPGMVLVEGGTFRMGTDEISDEHPIHSVTLNSFHIGKYEVTQAEWNAVMGSDNNPSLYKGDNLPVETVTWYNTVEYCNKRSELEGLQPCYTGEGDKITCDFTADGYRLPTETEWEYACRGGLKSRNYKYSGSNNPDEVGWYGVNSEGKTQLVGRKKPNELEIYDMSGNAWEWCWDWYDEDYYKHSPADNPGGPATGGTRVYRGGGCGAFYFWLRNTGRYSNPPNVKHWFVGFRVVKKPAGHGKEPEGMVFVKGGVFKMGSNEANAGQRPAHPVTVSNFYIGKFEVTQEEWKAVMGNNPSFFKGAWNPVHSINWYAAIGYCNRRSRIEGLTPCYTGKDKNITCDFKADGYRLPTEAEWEYAARGGLKSRNYKYSGSNDPNEVAWYGENAGGKAHPVGMKKANELGIYDMSGNVWEWCWDWYDFYYYEHSPAKNPKGPAAALHRIKRGGDWRDPLYVMTCTFRFYNRPHIIFHNLGFRVVRTAR